MNEAPAPCDDVAAARAQLVFLLQLAVSGELGAIRAYLGHRASLPRGPQRARVDAILRDEIRHRRIVSSMLRALGSAPDPRRERKMDLVGRSIAFSCLVGGWFMPMYGAGRLESGNVGEYEHAARLAVLAGRAELADPLLELAEIEWDHERFFREQAMSHVLWRVMPAWPSLPPREEIRRSFRTWLEGSRRVAPIRVPWLIR